MTGEHIEIRVEIAHVDVEMHRALRAVDQHRHAMGMGDGDDVLDRRHRAQHIGHLGDGDDLRALGQRALERIQRERAVVGDIDPFQHRALAFAMEMPGHDIGMMLHHGKHDFIALPDMGDAEAGGDQVDRLRRRARKNDLVVRGRIEKPAHGFARRLVSLGRRVGQIMQAAMHIGVFVLVSVRQAFDHRPRLLRRGGIVEIDQRLAIGALGQNRKIGAQGLGVERQVWRISHEFVHAAVSLARIPAMKFLPQDNFAATGPPGATSRQNGVTSSARAPALISSITASDTIRRNMLDVIGQVTSAAFCVANSRRMSKTSRVAPRGSVGASDAVTTNASLTPPRRKSAVCSSRSSASMRRPPT